MKNTILIFTAVLAMASLIAPAEAKAQYYSQSNGSYSVVVDKKISDVKSKEYYDNISSSKKLFVEGDEIDFQITVTNTGNKLLENLVLVDNLPNNLNLKYFPGTVDNSKISYTIGNLDIGQTVTYNIRANIANVASSTAETKWSRTNRVCVSNNNASDCDNATYYIAGKLLPNTGSESILVYTGLMVIIAGGSMVARKLIRGY